MHDEAEHLEHAVSDFLIERIDDLLGRPTRDPHGDPIPAADGSINAPLAVPLSAAVPGERVVVERIDDADPQLLQHFADRGVLVGAVLRVGQPEPYSEALEVTVAEGGQLSLGRAAAASVWVSSGDA